MADTPPVEETSEKETFLSRLVAMLHMIRKGQAHMIDPAEIDALNDDAKDIEDAEEDVDKLTVKPNGGSPNAA